MTDYLDIEPILDDWLTDGVDMLPDRSVDAVLATVQRTSQRRAWRAPWRTPHVTGTPRRMAAILGVAALVALLLGGTSLIGGQRSPATPTTPVSTATSTLTFIWTPNAANADWPGPLRTERPADAALRFRVPDFVDAVGDVGAPMPLADISHVTLRMGNTVDLSNPIGLQVGAGLATIPKPTASWIAYGVVLDLDGDGQPDQRIGIDNSSPDHREWVTDIATGRTESNVSGVYGAFRAFGTGLETWFVGPDGLAALNVKRQPAGIHYYAWASVISGGRIVATDFAPDHGWIETVSP